MELKMSFLMAAPLLLVLASGCLDEEGSDGRPLDMGSENKNLVSIPIALDEGQTGTISIPFLGVNFLDTDVKHHWNMPTNVSGVRVNLTWQDQGWDLELATGTGECPHQGTLLASSTGSSGELSVEYFAGENETLQNIQWFAHIAVMDASSHRGDSMDFIFEVTLLTYDKEACEGDVCPV